MSKKIEINIKEDSKQYYIRFGEYLKIIKKETFNPIDPLIDDYDITMIKIAEQYKQLEKENEEMKTTIKSIRKTAKRILNQNFEMRKLLLKQGIDFNNGFSNLLEEVLNDKKDS